MRNCRINLPNRRYHLIGRVAHRAFEFEGLQAANRKGCAAMTRKTYCGNLLWQSGLTLLALLSLYVGGEAITPADKKLLQNALERAGADAYLWGN
jgi:hypothetical protein